MNKNILHIPSLAYFGNDWNVLQNFLKHRGNPPFHIDDNLGLNDTSIESLGNLISVGGYLDLENSQIKSLGNLTSVGGRLDLFGTPIESLGNLTSVGGTLDLRITPIESLGNLTSVGGYLFLENTPISKTMTKDDIRSQVNVEDDIYF